MKKRDLILELTASLQETRILAVTANEGDPWYAQDADIDADAVLKRARDVLEIAEDYRENPEALKDYDRL